MKFKKKLEEKGATQKGLEKPNDIIISVRAGIKSIVSNLTGGDTSTDDSNTCFSRSNVAERPLGGRSIGSTKKRKRREAKNEIAQRMMEVGETAKRDNKK